MIRWLRHMVLLLALTGLFCSCSQVEDARQVVAEADSLRAVGSLYDDSLSIAEAAATLSHVRILYPTDYARANYYYGRLLRTRGDQPAAMQAFLRAVHSRTKDHEMIARSYCNIANMCRLAAEHDLAYEINGLGAQEFLLYHDSLMYYHTLICQAVERAEQAQKDEAIAITNLVESNCQDEGVLIKVWETRADAYVRGGMYDSAIYCVRELQSRGNDEPTGYMIMAQAFDGLGQNDSALYYAQKTMEKTNFYGDRYNALYILSHSDSTLTTDEALTLTSEREDVRFYEYEPAKVKLTQAVQLLRQDLNRKPDYTWLWAILATALIFCIPGTYYISRKRKDRQLISQQTEELRQEKEQLELHQTQRQATMRQELEANRLAICNSHDWQTALQWKDFDTMCDRVNKHFFLFADKLIATRTLDEKEIRLCVLVFLDMFSLKQMAAILPYSQTGIRTYKSRVNDKLGNKGHDLRTFLVDTLILGYPIDKKQ